MVKWIAYIYKFNKLGVLPKKIKAKRKQQFIEFQKPCLKFYIPVLFIVYSSQYYYRIFSSHLFMQEYIDASYVIVSRIFVHSVFMFSQEDTHGIATTCETLC